MDNKYPPKRMRWAELLDVLTDTDRDKKIVIEKTTETERMAIFLLRRDEWSVKSVGSVQKNYSLELFKPVQRVAVQILNKRNKVYLGQIEKFLDFLSQPESQKFTGGYFISTSGFTPSVYSYLREEGITNIKLAILRGTKLIWNCEEVDIQEEKQKPTYFGVFTCKGGVGKTTIAAHLSGAFAMNGYDVALVDLDKQQNLRKLLGEGVYIPARTGKVGSVVNVLSPAEWDEREYKDTKIVICDCNPEFDANPVEFIRKFDYCLMPTTLNPLGINKNADVIKRTFNSIRRENAEASLMVLINSLQSDEEKRNRLLNRVLKTQFKQIAERDGNCHYIDPADVAIRFSKQLMYWGFHLFDNSKPSLAFRPIGRYSYPRMDFLKLVDYLELHTEIKPKLTSLAAKL
jgi:chromosome partitioning protein